MNGITQYIASKTMQTTDWQNSILLEGDVAEAVSRLKAEPGKDFYVLGSGNLSHKTLDSLSAGLRGLNTSRDFQTAFTSL